MLAVMLCRLDLLEDGGRNIILYLEKNNVIKT